MRVDDTLPVGPYAPLYQLFIDAGNSNYKREEDCFFINPEHSNDRLIKCIDNGFYVLFHGVRGIGKTTRTMYAIKYQLPKYCCLYISLQSLEYSDHQIRQ